MRRLASNCDHYTGLSRGDVEKLESAWHPDPEPRADIIARVLADGAAWETSTSEIIAATDEKAKKTTYAKKRVGCREIPQ